MFHEKYLDIRFARKFPAVVNPKNSLYPDPVQFIFSFLIATASMLILLLWPRHSSSG
jgi:hypothetical protein